MYLPENVFYLHEWTKSNIELLLHLECYTQSFIWHDQCKSCGRLH